MDGGNRSGNTTGRGSARLPFHSNASAFPPFMDGEDGVADMVGGSSRLISLASVLSNSGNGRLNDMAMFRRYVSTVNATIVIDGREETSSKPILYQIGATSLNPKDLLVCNFPAFKAIDQTVRTRELLVVDLTAACKKFSVLTPLFDTMDMSAIAFQLARALAVYVQTGVLTCAMIRAGQPMRVRSIATSDVPLRPADGHVFVPRQVDEYVGGTFAVISAAANAFGSTIFTDVLAVDQNNAPTMMEPVNSLAAMACWSGLQHLLSMYETIGQGTVIAYAITRGIHDVATVVAHSYEGGYMRDVLRKGSFRKPYGGISATYVRTFDSLPAPTVTSESTFVAFVDSIALATAGLSACSDPTVIIEGRAYPTVFTDTVQALTDETVMDQAQLNALSLRMNQQIAQACTGFVSNYIDNLGKLFNTTGGGIAKAHLSASFAFAASVVSRHTWYRTLSFCYWVEPTSLSKTKFACPANDAGFGVIAGTSSSTAYPTFEKSTVTHSFGTSYGAAVKFRTMRTSMILVALANNALDGMAHIVPTQFLDEKMTLKGGVDLPAVARAASESIDQYNWVSQQSPIPHPASCIYIGQSMGLHIKPYAFDERNMAFARNHVPSSTDLAYDVVMSCSMPGRVADGRLGVDGRALRRFKDHACIALTNARVLAHAPINMTGGEIFSAGNFEPNQHFDPDPVDVGGGEAMRGLPTAIPNSRPIVGRATPAVFHAREARVPMARPHVHGVIPGGAGEPRVIDEVPDPGDPDHGGDAPGGVAVPAAP